MKKITFDVLRLAREILGRDLVDVFDGLRKGQKIKVAYKSVMGTEKYADGSYHDWVVKSKSRGRRGRYERVQIVPADRPPGVMKVPYYLWKREFDGEVFISMSSGDMAV